MSKSRLGYNAFTPIDPITELGFTFPLSFASCIAAKMSSVLSQIVGWLSLTLESLINGRQQINVRRGNYR